MVESQRRFPWGWLWAGAVVLVIVAAVFGFIETVGRQGTIIGRYDAIDRRFSRDGCLKTLGPFGVERPDLREAYPFEGSGSAGPGPTGVTVTQWREGPATVTVWFEERTHKLWPYGPVSRQRVFYDKELRIDKKRFLWWEVRRWAEQAYTAIHVPRR